MKIVNLCEKNSIVCQYLAELRDKKIQKDSMRFRRNMERIGMYAAMEISKTLAYKDTEIATPLGIAQCKTLADKVVISSEFWKSLTRRRIPL